MRYSGMSKNRKTVGPMGMQPVDRATTATPTLPMMPAAGQARKAVRNREAPRAMRSAKAEVTRLNSLRKQREAMKG